MIYRIEFDRNNEVHTDVVIECINEWFSTKMTDYGLKAPYKINMRTRFWFTERGWERVGKVIMKELNSLGANVKVKKRKNPKMSDVYWCDSYQVALLPRKKGKK